MILFGAGTVGKAVYRELKLRGVAIEAFVDNNSELHGSNIDGIPIKSPKDYCNTKKQVMITISVDIKNAINSLRKLGIYNILSCADVISLESVEGITPEYAKVVARQMNYETSLIGFDTRRELVLMSVDIVITEACPMRCRDCSNLMQYFDRPRESDFNMTIQSFERLYTVSKRIHSARLIGGDAMASKLLPDYIKYLSGLDRIDEIAIYTNGVIVPNEKLLSVLNDDRIIFLITDYGNPKQRIQEFEDILTKNSINYRISSPEGWQDCAKIYRRGRIEDELKKMLAECCVADTPSLKDGKLWRCPTAGSLAALDAMPKSLCQYVDLTSDSVSDDDLRDDVVKLITADCIYACDYCGGRPRINENPIKPAIQTAHPLPYKKEQ